MDISALQTDAQASAGKYFSLGTLELLIAPRGSKYETKLARLVEKFRKMNRNREPKGDQFRAINIEATVGTCLLGWKEGTLTNGDTVIPYKDETAIYILSTYPPIRQFVFQTIERESGSIPEDEEDDTTEAADRAPQGPATAPETAAPTEEAEGDSAALKS